MSTNSEIVAPVSEVNDIFNERIYNQVVEEEQRADTCEAESYKLEVGGRDCLLVGAVDKI